MENLTINTDMLQQEEQISLTTSLVNKCLLLFAALCFSLSIIFFIAANWDNFYVNQKFYLLESILIISSILTIIYKNLRLGFLMLMIFTIGGLLALFAQVYGSMGDPWQLFALWALFALPLAWVAKHQIIWGIELLLIYTTYLAYFSISIFDIYDSFSMDHLFYIWSYSVLIAIVFYPFSFSKKWLGQTHSHVCFCIAFNLSLILAYNLIEIYTYNSMSYFSIVLIYYVGIYLMLYAMNFRYLSIYITLMILADIVSLRILFDLLINNDYGINLSNLYMILFIFFIKTFK